MSARLLSLPHLRLPHLRLPRRAQGRRVTWPLRGPGTVFTKGMRDSRRAILLAGIGLGALLLLAGAATAQALPTAASRLLVVAQVQALPGPISGLFAAAINIDRLGGLISWRYGNLMPIFLGLWSIVALSGTLAGEIRAGSFEALAGVPLSRRRIAREKLAVHLVGLALAVVLMAIFAWLTGIVYATLRGDAIAFSDALVHFTGSALFGLVGGAIAFALAPFAGRTAAAGLGAVALFGAYFVNAYAGVVSAFNSLKGLSWFAWTANERPLAGRWDVGSLVPVVALIAVFLAIGVVAFERRDLGSTVPVPAVALPGRRFLLRGPARQAFMGLRAGALAWGAVIGLFAWLIASASPGFVQFASDPGIAKLMDLIFRDVNWRTVGGFLQLIFFTFLILVTALAGATFVNGLASDEQERRLELLLATPVSRVSWLVAGGLGLYAALALLTLLVGLFVAAGAASAGQDAVQPFIGVWVGGLYAAGLAGVGIALYGLGAVGLAAPVTAALALGFLTWDLVASSIRLSPDLLALTLTRHLGQPMVGTYDWPGMALLAALAIGGLVVGAWGMRRRDLST